MFGSSGTDFGPAVFRGVPAQIDDRVPDVDETTVVSDHDDGAFHEAPAQIVDEVPRGLVVEVCRRFVEDDDTGSGEQGPRHRKALSLTAGDSVP